MATILKLDYNGQRLIFSEWGITGVVLHQESQGIDTLTFVMPSVQIDDDYLFDYRGTVSLYRDDGAGDVRCFYGVVTRRSGQGSSSESHSYEVSCPAWHLSRLLFQQDWKILKTGAEFPLEDDDYETIQLGHILLNVTTLGAKTGTAAQLEAILDVAIARGAPMAYDETGFPDVDAPIDEIRNVTIGECIQRELRWAPDCVWYWDYSTDPYPTMHIRRRSALEAKALNITEGRRVESIQMDPRDDLLLDGVILRYRFTSRVNDAILKSLVILKAPNDAVQPGVAVLDQDIDLEGSTYTYIESPLATEAIDADNVDWWKARIDPLSKSNIKELTIVAGSVTRNSSHPYEIRRGQYADWMGGNCSEDSIQAQFSYTIVDDAGNEIKKITGQTFSHHCNVTDRPSGAYRSTEEDTPAEPIPTNLHTYLYQAASVLHYDGQIVLTDDECPGDINVGNVLNISDSRPEWANMRALVQSVTMDLDNRRTTIQVGPPKHLGHADIIELLRVTRFRMRYTPATARSKAQGSSGALQLPDRVAKENTQQSTQAIDRYVIGGFVTPTGATEAQGLIDINKADVGGRPAKFRTLLYCETDSAGITTQYELEVLCTEKRVRSS